MAPMGTGSPMGTPPIHALPFPRVGFRGCLKTCRDADSSSADPPKPQSILNPLLSFDLGVGHLTGIGAPCEVLRVVMGAWRQCRGTLRSLYLCPCVEYGQ